MAKLLFATVLISALVGPALMQGQTTQGQVPSLQGLGESLGQGLSNLPGMQSMNQQGMRQPMQNGGGPLSGLLGGGLGQNGLMPNGQQQSGGLMGLISNLLSSVRNMLPGMGRNGTCGMNRNQMNMQNPMSQMPSNAMNQLNRMNPFSQQGSSGSSSSTGGLLTETTKPVNDLLANLQGGNQNGLSLKPVTVPVDNLLQGVTGGSSGATGGLNNLLGGGSQGGLSSMTNSLTRSLSNVLPLGNAGNAN